MTPFETASLWAAFGHITVAATIGLGQIAIVWYGIRTMQKMGAQRAREQDSRHEEVLRESERRHEEVLRESDRRHEEGLRESDRRHEEALRESDRRHEEAMKSLAEAAREGVRRHEEAMQALEALIERTGGRAPA